MTVGELAMQNGLLVCVGTGGVGKTTIAAAIALGAAAHGRQVAVLTIDPARQLARSLGLDALAPGGQRVPPAVLANAGVEMRGTLDAGMLDQKRAWDAFIRRLMPSDELRDRVLGNGFYQQLSSSFPGSNEYMAIEEVCRLAESGRYELVVLDTPPAAHALEFLRAPDRIARLLDRDVFDWLARPYEALGLLAQRLAHRIERATGQSTLHDISGFLGALHGHVDALVARSRQARALLQGAGSAFVLVARPQQLVLAQTEALADTLRTLHSPLAAVVANRVHPVPEVARADARAAIDGCATGDVADWLEWAWDDAVGEATTERSILARLADALPGVVHAAVPEADSDVHSVRQLARIGDVLWG